MGGTQILLKVMKKLLLALAGVAMMSGSAMAQDYEKNIYGARAGLNVANISVDGYSPNSKVGFHVSGVYQRLLTSSMPFYLETGLSFSQKGCKVGSEVGDIKVNSMYLQIPVMVNYKFNIKDVVTLYPSVGFYYGMGLGGKIKGEGYKVDTFGKEGALKRSDFGMRISGTVEWKKFSFGLGYEFGFINVGNNVNLGDVDFDDEDMGFDGEDYGIATPKVKTGNFFTSIGYNF